MVDVQRMVFDWAAMQPAAAGLALFGGGLVSGFMGYRLQRVLLGAVNVGVGCLLGWLVAKHFGYPVLLSALGGGALLGFIAVVSGRAALILAGGMLFSGLAGYLGLQLHLPELGVFVALGVGLLAGLGQAALCPRSMGVVLTTLVGAVLLVVGFVSLTAALIPSLGSTFRVWASSWSLVIPVLMGMLVVMCWSIQATAQQGDLRTGPQVGPRHEVS